jgi:photosystem II stability/assembly factor-like uncharacterized protein
MKQRIPTALFIFFLLFVTAASLNAAAKPTTRHHRSKKKHSHSVVHRSKKTKKDTQAKNDLNLQKHYPPPGSSGEDRNQEWYYKRAFPNDHIDPDLYAKALDQARALPVYGTFGKNATQSAMQWQQIGPYSAGGRVTAIATHPTDSNIFYVGAAAGGVWKTTDHGNSWKALLDTFPAIATGCLTIDPTDPNTIYLGMGECNGSADSYPGTGLYRSTDAGLNWDSLGLGRTQYISKVIVDPSDKNTIYVCSPGPSSSDTNAGIWKSTDHGATWKHALLIKTSVVVSAIDLVMNPTDTKDLVAAMWDKYSSTDTSSGLWRTRDGGATWKRIDGLSPSYPNGAKVKRLSRTSLLWTLNTSGVPTLYSVTTKNDVNPVTHFASDADLFGIFKTTDPEGTWTKLLDSTYRIPYLGNNVDSCDLFYRQGEYNNFIVAHPTHRDEIYVGGIDVIRSTDGGASWTDITRAYPRYFNNDRSQHSDQHALAFTAAKSGNDLLNGQDGGVFNTRDFGNSWTRIDGLPITMLYYLETWDAGMTSLPPNFPATSIKLFGGTQDNGTIGHGFSSNPDWDWINRGDGGEAQADPNNKNHLVTSIELAKVYFRTTLDSLRPNLYTDNGNLDPNTDKWFDLAAIAKRRGITDSTEPSKFIAPVQLDKIRGDEVYSGKTHVYHAKLNFTNPDSATVIKTWSPLLGGVTDKPKQWFYGGDIEALALGVRDQNNRPMIWAGGIVAPDSSLSSGGTHIWRTTYNPSIPQDSAPNWINASGGLPFSVPSAIACDRSDSLTAFVGLLSYGGGVIKHLYKTTNGGTSWTVITGKKAATSLPTTPVTSIVIDSLAEQGNPSAKNQCIIVATDVGVFITTDGGNTWANLGTGMPHLVVETIKMYKNWLIAGTHGRSAWALDISSVVVPPSNAVSEELAPNSFHLESIYPNPIDLSSAASVHIKLHSTDGENLKIEFISEATGATAFSTRSEIMDNEIAVQLPSHLSAGKYLVRITKQDGETAVGQVIVVK